MASTTPSRAREKEWVECSRCMPMIELRLNLPWPVTSSRWPASSRRRRARRCDKDNAVILEKMDFPEPVISVAVEAKSKKDQDKMGEALARLAAEDPSFRTKYDEENAQTIISGMGELHLEIIVDRLQREFGVEANVGAPQVSYREAITAPAEVDFTHKKQP